MFLVPPTVFCTDIKDVLKMSVYYIFSSQKSRERKPHRKRHSKCNKDIQIETKNKHLTLLFIAYIEVTFLNL